MSTYANAQALLTWFGGRSSATVSEIVISGLMKSRTASNAIQYAMRNGALERIFSSGAIPKERVRYRATGIGLPAPRTAVARSSFDDLLEAWGIARQPISLPTIDARRHEISDNEQEVT